MIKSIQNLQDDNSRQLFSQFRLMNSNKIIHELNDWPDIIIDPNQCYITEEELIEALRHISLHKARTSQYSQPDDQEWRTSNGRFVGATVRLEFQDWPRSNIVEESEHHITQNYSPIALLSGVGKLLERIITMRLMWYLNENKLLHQCQAGFQSCHNTYELLLRLTESINASFDNNSVAYAVLLDISSAYDSVWIYELFETGLPHESSLLPLLFILYINDITQAVQHPIQAAVGSIAAEFILGIQIEDDIRSRQDLVDYVQDEEQEKISKNEITAQLNGHLICRPC
ncbi:hypothetical protein RFI_07912 [Reticulomyxa filosa]|uniref:Reverse transcriptase domain-containing protein n=1 Tax=Reticulomyxa filosa TaxID=46433 RepID=X6NTV0_RETFI|nr:hypothetical protein RFI_07912 [Reticulomyxa filosa]|eukprot:ETO29214.1 hypothetical protein RFI_07912 [Reticulomyxa filosa]